MTHCERCGHPLSSHDENGKCSHAVNFGPHGVCTCDNYLRAVVSLPEMLAAALHAGPGRDAQGSFYSAQQARLVARYAEALLDTVSPEVSITALELCEAWSDAGSETERRSWSLEKLSNGTINAVLRVFQSNSAKVTYYEHASPTARDAAAKAIMKAGQAGFGS